MLLSVLVVGVVIGALLGGSLPRLFEVRLRWLWLIGLAIAIRLVAGVVFEPAATPALGLLVPYLLVLGWMWGNWRVRGLQVAAVGVVLNLIAVGVNSGLMPVWDGAFAAAGFAAGDIAEQPFHFLLAAATRTEFIRAGGLFGETLPIPFPVIRDVLSLGDVLIGAGVLWAIVAAMTRPDIALRRSVVVGASALAPSSAAGFEAGVPYAGQTEVIYPPPATTTKRRSPYLLLLGNRNYVLVWLGQLVSLMGDRIHTIAVGVLVVQRGTPLDVGIVFAMAAVPSVILGPFAGAFADRWDRRKTMIACDIVRAGLVLLVPVVIDIHIGLVYLTAFLVATVGLLFRPSKDGLVPQIVGRDELVTANSATSVTETLADLIGYPLAGVLVAALASTLWVAFVIDAASYLVSALFLWFVVAPRLDRVFERLRPGVILRDMAAGWRFLTHQPELRANTVVSTIAQIAVGTEVVCSLLYAESVLDTAQIGYPQNYALLMASIGLGSIIGGLGIGAFGARLRKGPAAIAGFIGLGLCFIAAGLVTDPYIAIGLFFLAGAANMAFVIPNITLFQDRTPQEMFARVVSSRQALVFGVMAAAMGAAGYASGIIGPERVLMVGGAVAVLAGLGGLAWPAMRNAE
jgi:MFS family permease